MTSPNLDNLFDSYIDGLLEGDQLARFEEALLSDQQLRIRVEANQQIDDSIRRIFTPKAAIASIPEEVATAPAHRFTRRTKLTIAACVGFIVMGVAATMYLANTNSSGVAGKIVFIEPADLYQQLEESSFTPDWVCGNEQEFVEYTTEKFGEPFLIHESTGLTLAGWTVSRALSLYTGVLMAKADGADIVLLVDRVKDDRELHLPKKSDLHLFRSEIGGLVLYEITPGIEPVILPRVYQPEASIPPAVED